MINLVRKLGLRVSWKKVVSPTKHVTFLGVDIDTNDCVLFLGADKLNMLHDKLKTFKHRQRATQVQLQSLAGSLNWACHVVRGGRFFLRRILDSIKPLRLAKHKTKLNAEFRKDLAWWLTFLSTFNGRQYYTDRHDVHVLTDACCTASGCFWAGDWHYSVFHADWPKVTAMHINYKEVCAVASAVARWAPLWAGRTVVVHTDTAVTKAILNKGRSKNAFINDVLRAVCWRSVTFDFELRAIHVPGCLIGIPDAISRLHETRQPERLARLFTVVLAPRPSAPRPHRGPHVVAFIPLSVSTGAAKELETALQAEVARFRGETFADNTKRTYASHRNSYLRFCTELSVCAAGTGERKNYSYSYVCCLFK